MENEEIVPVETLETPAEVPAEVTPGETPTDEKDKKIAEFEEKNAKLFERAKKAEAAKKEMDGMSPKDTIYLAKTDIHEDDIGDVIEMARLKRITVQEAHKYLIPILKERQEERATAAVTATGRQRPAPSAKQNETILSDAQRGILPDDDDGIRRLAEAELEKKLKR